MRNSVESEQNKTCRCFDLKNGAVMIGITNSIFYIFLYSWYLVYRESLKTSLTLDIVIFVSFAMMILVNTLLIVGSVKRLSSYLYIWLCSTGSMLVLAVMILIATILFPSDRNYLGNQYLSLVAFVIGMDFFFWFAIFVLRKNIMAEESLPVSVRSKDNGDPPSYSELEAGAAWTVGTEDPPPEYETLIAQMKEHQRQHEIGLLFTID